MILALLGVLQVVLALYNDLNFIRGGMKESGIGRENGIEAFESCTLKAH